MINKRLIIIFIIAAMLLSIPFISMQFTSEVDWKIQDFIIMGILLFGTGLIFELVMRKVKTIKNRILICLTILIIFLLVWTELAVGILGTPFAGS